MTLCLDTGYTATETVHEIKEVDMNIPLEITYRDIEKTQELEALVREKAQKLEQVCDYISGIRIALEMDQKKQRSGNPYRVRLDITVPPGHEIVVEKDPGPGDEHINIAILIRRAFDAAWRQLRELKEKQHDDQKRHPHQETQALVESIFPDEGYGFIRTNDEGGRSVYFHRNSVLHGDFDRLEVGTGVHFEEEMGDKGPQATSVQIMDKPGVRLPKKEG